MRKRLTGYSWCATFTRMTEEQFRDYLHTLVAKAGSQRKLAAELGVSGSYLSDLLLGNREPGPKILEILGFAKSVQIVRKVGYQPLGAEDGDIMP